MAKINPFITSGYISAEYFCDRIIETATLTRYITNGNNVALISPRRLGKTGLIEHCFHQKQIKEAYHTFLIDIYATKNLQEFVFELGKGILNGLKPRGRKAWEVFLKSLSSLRTSISFDFSGNPSWNLEMGDIKTPTITLDEIFHYLEQADKPCLISIDIDIYTEFIKKHFTENKKIITEETVQEVYQRFEGITWYIQFLANSLYAITAEGEECTVDKVNTAVDNILAQLNFTYSSLLFQLPPKQKEVLIAICKEGKAREITSSKFLKTYG